MTYKSAAAIREFAEKQFPLSKELKKEVLYNQIQQAKQNECFSDLTALISEHYVSREEYNELLRQRDELRDKYSQLLEYTSEFLKSMRTDNGELKKSIAEMSRDMASEAAAIKNTDG